MMALRPVEDRTVHAPETWRSLMRAGTDHLQLGEFPAAARSFRQAARIRRDHTLTLHQLAGTLLRAGRPVSAGRVFARLTRLAPHLPAAWHGLGLALHARGDPQAALTAFRQAVRLAPEAWRSWQSIADITPVESERMDALAGACRSLALLAVTPAGGPGHLLHHADALADLHAFRQVADLVQAGKADFPGLAALPERRARALYNLGLYRAAFEEMKAALAMTARLPGPALSFDPAGAITVLAEVSAILAAAGLAPFAAAGTLLGLERQGSLLAHDRDVDIGVLQQGPARPDIAAVIRQHPALILERRARPGERYYALNHRGVAVDIFVYEPAGDHLLCGFSDRHGDIQWRFSAFTLREAAFAGRRIPVPSPPGRYLEQAYGPAWRVPDPGFASAIGSPGLYRTDPWARATCSAARARMARAAGNEPKAAALAAQSPIPFEAGNAGQEPVP